jgi:hypothetical protein
VPSHLAQVRLLGVWQYASIFHLGWVRQEIIELDVQIICKAIELVNENPLPTLLDVCDRGAGKPCERAQIVLGDSTLFPELGQPFANEFVYGFGGVWRRHGCILGFGNDAVKCQKVASVIFD